MAAATTRLVLITGAPGVGKTSVAQALAVSLDGTVARLCGDVFVLAVTPFEISVDRRLFLRHNLASFVRHSLEHAYDWALIECVIPSDAFIADLVAEVGLPDDCVFVFSLVADDDAYRARLRAKAERAGASDAGLRACEEWMERIRALELPTPIDTSRRGLEDTTSALQKLLRL